MKPEALVILTPGFAANEADTTCLPPQQIFVKALKQAYPDVHLIILTFHYPFRTDQYYWFGSEVISFDGKDWGKGFRLNTWIKVWKKLGVLKRQYNLLGILSFWLGECSLVGQRFAKRHGLKHHIWLLGQDAKAGNRYFKRSKLDGNNLIALSDFVADSFAGSYGIRPQHTIPVGIDIGMFAHSSAERDIDILGAGSLIPLKQYHLLIEVVRIAKIQFPKLRVAICGKGPEEEKLKQLIWQYQLENNISLLGEIPHNEVIKLMQRSRIFLHPSAYEGFGAVIAEALYAGAHVVSFCRPMNGEIEHHYVVNNINELQKRVIELLKHKNLEHRPVLLYSSTQIAQQMMELYR